MNINNFSAFIRTTVMSVALFFYCIASNAETRICSAILALPVTISTPGIYCLKRDLSTQLSTGAAITITANNVTIDFNGRTLSGAAGPGSQAFGVYAADRSNLTLRNGTITGFNIGVFLDDTDRDYSNSGSHLLEGLTVDGNTVTGLQIEGRTNTLNKNRVTDTGGSTVAGGIEVTGILINGPQTMVLDNTVARTVASGNGTARGIQVSASDADDSAMTLIRDNRISNTITAGTGKTYGIDIRTGGKVLLQSNVIINPSYTSGNEPLETGSGTAGILGFNASETVCSDNRIAYFVQGFADCADDGNTAF